MTQRGTTNRNQRGNSTARRRRRVWLVTTFGDGTHVLCFRCRCWLTVDTVTSDRVRPGVTGGRYVRTNLRPMCGTCNSAIGGRLGAARRYGATAIPAPHMTDVQRRRLTEIRCHPTGQLQYDGRQARPLDRLAELGLVHLQRRWIGGRLALDAEPLGEGVAEPVALTLDLVVAG